MKKQAYVMIALTSILFVLFFSHSLLDILDFDWSIFLHDVEKTEKFVFLLLVFSMSMTCLLALFWRGVEELSLRKMQVNLKRLLSGKEVVQVADPDLDASFKSLSGKLNLLTEALQKAENQSLAQEEEIIEKERKRIARDLHDTVSQELFAAHMILSGVSQQALKLDREKMQTQLQSVTAILETAQKDLRVLLLHLRPIELEQKSLVEGIQLLLKELEEKIIERYNDLIKSGDIKALNDLGEFYIWIKQDEKGNKLLKEAADKGYKPAQETLERKSKDNSFGEQKLQEYQNNYKETGDIRILRTLASFYVSLKKYDLAEKTYLQLIELENYQPDYASLAQMYDYKTQNYENAIKYYKLAIEKISNKTQKFDARDYWVRIGDMYFLQNNFVEAEKAYKNSMAFKHPTDGKTYERNMLIEIYKSQGRTEEMKKLEKQNKSWWNN